MNANRTHANRPSALTAADRAKLAAHIANKPSKDAIVFAVALKLAAVSLVVGFLGGCI